MDNALERLLRIDAPLLKANVNARYRPKGIAANLVDSEFAINFIARVACTGKRNPRLPIVLKWISLRALICLYSQGLLCRSRNVKFPTLLPVERNLNALFIWLGQRHPRAGASHVYLPPFADKLAGRTLNFQAT